MAKWNDTTQTLMLNQDDRIEIEVEGIGTFVRVTSTRFNDTQALEIYEYLNEEVIYANDIPEVEA